VVTGTLKTPDGVTLRFARWAPPAGRKGTVCLFTGRAEFIEKYFETVRDLRSRGFAVAMIDWRGQGLSERALSNPLRGYVRTFDDYSVDLATFVQDVVLPDCPPPVFALAHSMGASILLRAAHEGHRWFDRMVLLAPMIGLPGSVRRSLPTRLTVKAMRLLGLGGAYVPGGDASVMKQLSDPGYASKIRQPILIIAAGQDAIVSTPAIDNFAMRLRAGSRLIVPGARHELLQEQDRFRMQVLAAFDAFVPGTALFG
jgi:lysophospholipase